MVLEGPSTDPAPRNIAHVLPQGISLGFCISLLHAELRVHLNVCRLWGLCVILKQHPGMELTFG